MQVKSSQQLAQGRHRGFQIETFGPCIEVAYNVAMEEFVDGHKMSLVPDSDSRELIKLQIRALPEHGTKKTRDRYKI